MTLVLKDHVTCKAAFAVYASARSTVFGAGSSSLEEKLPRVSLPAILSHGYTYTARFRAFPFIHCHSEFFGLDRIKFDYVCFQNLSIYYFYTFPSLHHR